MLPEVVPHRDERMVYLVASKSKEGKRYRVDLLSNKGAGECSCKDWGIRRLPNILSGQPHGLRSTLCIHVIAARRYFLNGLLKELAKQESPQ